MAITSGYFNSVNGDRKYNADQMSEYFDAIVNQGVFQHYLNGLAVSAGTGLSVSVATGKAVIQSKWVKNDAAVNLTISAASTSYARIDAVVIRLSNSNRTVTIAVKDGTPSANPSAPSMTRAGGTYEMALAYVNVAANATSVTVTDKRSDTSVCGWATVAQQTSGEVDQMLNDMKTGFDGVSYPTPAAMVQGEDEKIVGMVEDLSDSVDATFATKNDVFQCKKYDTYTDHGSGILFHLTDAESGLPGVATFASGDKNAVYVTKDNKYNGILYQGTLGSSTGEFAPSSLAVCTDFIPVNATSELVIYANGTFTEGIAPTIWCFYYNANKEFITYSTQYNGGAINSNAAYVRIRFFQDGITPSDVTSLYIGHTAISNIFDGTLVQGTIGQNTGEFVPNYSGAVCTDYLSVSASTYYTLRYLASVAVENVIIFAYDSTKTWISPAIVFGGRNFQTPANTAYVRVRFWYASGITPSNITKLYVGPLQFDRDTTLATEYKNVGTVVNFIQPDPTFEQPNNNYIVYAMSGTFNLKTATENKSGLVKSQWEGKKLYTFGDSLTNMERWQDTTKALLYLESWEKKAVSGGTLHLMYDQIALTPASCNLMTFWIGTNDYAGSYGLSLGTITDDFSEYDNYTTDSQKVNNCTFYGCLKYCCHWLSTNRPANLQVLFITPVQRKDETDDNMAEEYGTNSTGYPLNREGHSLEEYAQAVIDVANMYGYPVLDLYHESGANLITCATLMDDGLHPSRAFAEVLGRKIAMRFLEL